MGQRLRLKVLLDLHTVPGSQNGSDNAGICGIVQWANHPNRVEMALSVLERLALRYGQDPALLGIEVLNEPMTSDGAMARKLGSAEAIAQRCPAADKAAAKQNAFYDNAWLEQFYRAAYTRIRKYLPPDKAVVFDDAFDVHHFADWVVEQNDFENVILDTHQYFKLAERKGEIAPTCESHVAYAANQFLEEVTYGQSKLPTIVGEWSLSNSTEGLETGSREERQRIYSTIANAQMEAFTRCEGWFY